MISKTDKEVTNGLFLDMFYFEKTLDGGSGIIL